MASSSLEEQISSYGKLYFNGKANSARRGFEALAAESQGSDAATRLQILEVLLDVCIHSYDQVCLVTHLPAYVEAAGGTPTANEVQRRHLALRVQLYLDQARSWGPGPLEQEVLTSTGWANESTADLVLYMRRQLLRANVEMNLDDYAAADRTLGKLLSVVASLENPEEKTFDIAYVLSDAIAVMLSIGQTERAFGLYAASKTFITAALPPHSVNAVAFRLTEARVLQEMGHLAASQAALDEALAKISAIELDEHVRESLISQAMTLKAVVVFAQGDLAGARAVIDAHPFKARFADGRAADGYEEVGYLAARAVVLGAVGQSDPLAAQALAAPRSMDSQSLGDVTDVYRAVGLAIALPPGADRDKALLDMGPRIITMAARQPKGGLGAWYRPGVVDRTLISLALGQHDVEHPQADAAVAFDLLQLAGRSGAAFDADALTVLGQAKDPAARRSIHQALRLKARRDQTERDGVREMAVRALNAPLGRGAWLRHDIRARAALRDFNLRLAELDGVLVSKGVTTSGANLVGLEQFQSVLRDDEVALAVAPLAGDVMAYMCVRRGSTQRHVLKADLTQARLDARIIQAGLTAGHAPSETLDAQFPVAAAVRLYDVLIRPFGDCVRPNDHVIWLPKLAEFPTPLAVLLAQAPPKVGAGYDLAAADWFVRSHAITYAGSASVVVAARTAGQAAGGDFDFLGVGDPVLTGTTVEGDARGAAVLRGVRGGQLSGLAPLPETRDELQRSARGFAKARLLLGGEATERSLRGEMVGSYRYLSFATHGLLRDDLDGLTEPALVLTAGSSLAGPDDGLLTASEIADLRLAARFVALSACNTANFDLTQFSQDLPALASAFAVAGVPATLATLWPVESETSKRVVADAFEILRISPTLGPAQALAQAQRAFLAAPPGKAYLHPRFWSPFVVLGDGGVSAVVKAETLTVTSTQAVKRGGVDRGTLGPTVQMGARRIASGYRKTADGGFTATLEAIDKDGRASATAWQAPLAEGVTASLIGGAVKAGPDRLVFAVNDVVGKTPTTMLRMRLFETSASLQPRALFALDLLENVPILNSSLALSGDDIVVTYSVRASNQRLTARDDADDYEPGHCQFRSNTMVERRDSRTGVVLGFKLLEGYVINSAAAGADGRIILAGSFAADCTSRSQATVVVLDRSMAMEPLYSDSDESFSEVAAMGATSDGRIVLAVNVANLLDYVAPREVEPQSTNSRRYMSAKVVVLDPKGGVIGTKMLDAGSDLLVSTIEASHADDLVIGGSVGGEATQIHLALKRP